MAAPAADLATFEAAVAATGNPADTDAASRASLWLSDLYTSTSGLQLAKAAIGEQVTSRKP
jgi:hypothetical protein